MALVCHKHTVAGLPTSSGSYWALLAAFGDAGGLGPTWPRRKTPPPGTLGGLSTWAARKTTKSRYIRRVNATGLLLARSRRPIQSLLHHSSLLRLVKKNIPAPACMPVVVEPLAPLQNHCHHPHPKVLWSWWTVLYTSTLYIIGVRRSPVLPPGSRRSSAATFAVVQMVSSAAMLAVEWKTE